jgi:hypothetical protein
MWLHCISPWRASKVPVHSPARRALAKIVHAPLYSRDVNIITVSRFPFATQLEVHCRMFKPVVGIVPAFNGALEPPVRRNFMAGRRGADGSDNDPNHSSLTMTSASMASAAQENRKYMAAVSSVIILDATQHESARSGTG